MMNEHTLAAILRDRADILEAQAGPGRGPRAPERPGGPSEDDVSKAIQRMTAAEYRELADAIAALSQSPEENRQ
jgi:hypothetical protein